MGNYVGTFSYQGGANPPIDWPRLMVYDTAQFGPDGITPVNVFWDQEIQSMTQIVMQQFQSSMFFTPPAGLQLPNSPIPYLRIAAGLIDCMVCNAAKLAAISKLLDVNLTGGNSANWLKQQAATYREVDDDAGAFMIIEQVNNMNSLQQRYWKQVQRQQGLNF